MKNLFKLGGFLIAFVLLANTTFAQQKFGYMNSASILTLMPEMKAAESQMEGARKQYQDKGQKMLQDLQTEFATVQQEVQQGVLSPKQQEEKGKALQVKEQEIQKYEQTMMLELQKREAELLEPILSKVKTAIDEVAAEGGYNFIFNDVPGAGGIILFKDESADVTQAVMKKLGLSAPATGGN